MTKYSEEFKKEVRDCHRKGMLLKQYKHDKIHTTKDVADKFGLTVEQTKNILYQKKFPNPTKYWGNKESLLMIRKLKNMINMAEYKWLTLE